MSNSHYSLNFLSYDFGEYIQRNEINKIIADIKQKSLFNSVDVIVLLNITKYVLYEIHRSEWAKNYFISQSYGAVCARLKSTQGTLRTHIVLSRYPFIKNETFLLFNC